MEPLLYVCLAMVVLTVGRIKIVEVGFGRRLKVFNFAVIDNRNVDPGRHSEQLNHTLQVRGFEAKDAIIAAGGGNAEHSENQTSWCVRSEEHTSELQSQFHLVCRLLLEKKKSKRKI